MAGTSLDFPNSGGLSAPVIFKGGNTSPADNFMKLVQADMASRERNRQPVKEEDFTKGLPTPWYKDIPELHQEVEKLRQIGAVMNDKRQPPQVRAQAAVDYSHHKGVIAQKFSKSHNDAIVYPREFMKVAKNPYGYEEGTDKYSEGWQQGGILERGDYSPKIANDKDAWAEFMKLPKDAISKQVTKDELQPDGFSKKRYSTTEYNPEEGGKKRLELWANGNSTSYRKATGVVEANIKKANPNLEETHPLEYQNIVDKTMVELADIHSRSQFKPAAKTLIMGAPHPPKGQTTQKSLSDMSAQIHEKDILTAKIPGVTPEGKIHSLGSMALPSGIKSRATVSASEGIFNPETNQLIKDDPGIIDFSGGEINVIQRHKGKVEPYIFATATKQIEKEITDDNGNVIHEKISYPIAIPLKDVSNILHQEGIQYKWAQELADKKNSSTATKKSYTKAELTAKAKAAGYTYDEYYNLVKDKITLK